MLWYRAVTVRTVRVLELIDSSTYSFFRLEYEYISVLRSDTDTTREVFVFVFIACACTGFVRLAVSFSTTLLGWLRRLWHDVDSCCRTVAFVFVVYCYNCACVFVCAFGASTVAVFEYSYWSTCTRIELFVSRSLHLWC